MGNWFTNLYNSFKTSPWTTLGGLLLGSTYFLPQFGVAANVVNSIGAIGGILLGAAARDGLTNPQPGPATSVQAASENLIAGVLQTALASHIANNAPTPPAK